MGTWEKYEEEQAEAVKAGLTIFGPLLSDFFMNIHEAIKRSQEILNYEITLNDTQRRAIKMVNNIPPQIEYKENDRDIMFDEMRKEWQVGSKCDIFSASKNKWFGNGEIVEISNDDEGEWLAVKYGQNKVKQIGRYSNEIRPRMNDEDNDNLSQLALRCKALSTASIISIDVTHSMMDRFNENIVTIRALTVARGVEDCCMQIIRSQSTIRHSVLLALQILKMRPAQKNKANKLWKAVDDGIISCMQTAIEMVSVSAKYFAYFSRFRHSLQFFEANKEKSMVISLQNIHRDCREFSVFRKRFTAKVQELSDSALDCIRNCVVTHVGATNFENARTSRDVTLKQWLDKKAIYDKLALELDEEFERAQIQKINISAERARLQCKVTMLEAAIKHNQHEKRNYVEAKAVLDKMVI